MITRDHVEEKVKGILVDSLDLEDDSIQLDDLMFANYDIESTEILEITFRIEEEFDFQIQENEFWNITNLIANDTTFSDMKSEMTRELINKYFDVSSEVLDGLDSPFELYDYIRVKDLVQYIQEKISE